MQEQFNFWVRLQRTSKIIKFRLQSITHGRLKYITNSIKTYLLVRVIQRTRSNMIYTFIESESESYSVLSNSLQPQGLCSRWNSPGQNTGVGSLSLLQGIFPTQKSNQGLLHCRWILYQLSYQGSLTYYKEIYFKELAHAVMEAGKSTTHGVDQQAGSLWKS